jgi:hypothetical protein
MFIFVIVFKSLQNCEYFNRLFFGTVVFNKIMI